MRGVNSVAGDRRRAPIASKAEKTSSSADGRAVERALDGFARRASRSPRSSPGARPSRRRCVPAVAPQRGVEVAAAGDRRGRLVHQPLGALEGPAAADAPERVARERRVAHEREAGPRRRAMTFGSSSLPSSFDSRVARAMPGPSGSVASSAGRRPRGRPGTRAAGARGGRRATRRARPRWGRCRRRRAP